MNHDEMGVRSDSLTFKFIYAVSVDQAFCKSLYLLIIIIIKKSLLAEMSEDILTKTL